MRPPVIPSPADHVTGVPRGFEAVVLDAPPTPRPCIAPPADDRFELARAFVLRACTGYQTFSARVLCQRAELGDREAWYAVSGDIGGANATATWRVAEKLGDGDLDGAVDVAAALCDETAGAWLARSREEFARKAGAP